MDVYKLPLISISFSDEVIVHGLFGIILIENVKWNNNMSIATLLRVVEDRDITFSKLFYAKGKG